MAETYWHPDVEAMTLKARKVRALESIAYSMYVRMSTGKKNTSLRTDELARLLRNMGLEAGAYPNTGHLKDLIAERGVEVKS